MHALHRRPLLLTQQVNEEGYLPALQLEDHLNGEAAAPCWLTFMPIINML